MTDKEMAEEYMQKNNVWLEDELVKQAYLEGLKKGRELEAEENRDLAIVAYLQGADKANKWHNLRKNPKDLPKDSDDKKLYSIYFGGCYYSTAQFENGRWWSIDDGWFDADDVIAWFKLPKFEEE